MFEQPLIATETLWVFALASAAIVIVPGPSVLVIVANSLKSGTRAGLMSVAGTQTGLLCILLTLALGFSAIVDSLSAVFDFVRLAGAVYLIWLGGRLWWASGGTRVGDVEIRGAAGDMLLCFWQSVLVVLSNPKVLLFFGAFFPQFVDPAAPVLPQVVLLGGLFMLIAAVLDSAYAVFAGRAGAYLAAGQLQLLRRLSGSLLIGGGLWMLLRRPV